MSDTNEARHIGWLETKYSDCKVFEAEDGHAAGAASEFLGVEWSHTRMGLHSPGLTSLTGGKALFCTAAAARSVRHWPEFTPVEHRPHGKMDECDLCKVPTAVVALWSLSSDRGTRQVCKSCFGPTGKTADALRDGGCVWAGVLEGALIWERENPTAFSHLVSHRVWANEGAKSPVVIERHRGEHCIMWPKTAEHLRSRGLLTRGEPDAREELPPEHTCQEAQRGCRVEVLPEDCEACQREEDSAGHEAAKAADKLGEAMKPIAEVLERERTWGDMMTPRDPTGPILTCGKPGHVTLYLERLSDDRKKAMKQLEGASIECAGFAVNKEGGAPTSTRTLNLSLALASARKAIDVGWKPEPFIQAIRDAHEAIGIERDWARLPGGTPVCGAGAKFGDSDLEARPCFPRVSELGTAGPGWMKR